MTFAENIHPQGEEMAPRKTGFTPRELVNRQIKDPNYHVTEEDIANMNISDALTEIEELKAGTQEGELKDNKAATSYDVLD